jgi:hypothetical protein
LSISDPPLADTTARAWKIRLTYPSNAVQIESTRTIEIDQFVPRNEIDDR